jgi:hypothetical protein
MGPLTSEVAEADWLTIHPRVPTGEVWAGELGWRSWSKKTHFQRFSASSRAHW